MIIRTFNPSDVESLLAVQDEAFPVSQWRASDYMRLAAAPGGMILVAEAETADGATAQSREGRVHWRSRGQVVGFAAASQQADEAELKNIAVRTPYRRQGVARALLEELHRRLLEAGANRVYLEVRPSNTSARELYLSVGYSLRYERKMYYQDPPEDALVLCLELLPDGV